MTSSQPPVFRRGLPLIVAVALFFALLGAIAMVASGFGYRSEIWGLKSAFLMFLIGAGIALLGGLLGVPAAVATRPGMGRRGFAASVVAVVVGIAGFGIMAQWYMTAKHAAPIHDITTDLTNPPAFVAILPLRAKAPNPAAYGGPALADSQRKAYPDLQPVVLTVAPGEAFHRALDAAKGMGWEIVATDSAAGRIEATATTRWFGFKDDVIVRVEPSPEGNGSRVDVRSVSRVGGSDVGTNARRIREYEKALNRA